MFWLVKEAYMRIIINKREGEYGNTVVLEIKNVDMFCYAEGTLQIWTTLGTRFEKKLDSGEWFSVHSRS